MRGGHEHHGGRGAGLSGLRRPTRRLWLGIALIVFVTAAACLAWYNQSTAALARTHQEHLDGVVLKVADLIEDRLDALRRELAVAGSPTAAENDIIITRVPLDGPEPLVPLSDLLAAAGSGPELGQPGLTAPYQLEGQWHVALVAAPDPRGTLAAVMPLAGLRMHIDDLAQAERADVLVLSPAGAVWWLSPFDEYALNLPVAAAHTASLSRTGTDNASRLAAWTEGYLVSRYTLATHGLQVLVRARIESGVTDHTASALILLTGLVGIAACFTLWRMSPATPVTQHTAGPADTPSQPTPAETTATAAVKTSANSDQSTVPFFAYAVEQDAQGQAVVCLTAVGHAAALGLDESREMTVRTVVERVAGEQQRDLEDFLTGKANAESAPPWLDWQIDGKTSTVLQHFPFRQRMTEDTPARIAGLLVVAETQFDEWTQLELSARDANSANTRKSRFLARLSHEMRTPLNAIIGFAELMEKETLGPVGTPRYRDYLSDIGASGRHLHELINDIIDISRVETGELDLSESILSVTNELDACVRFIRERLEASKLELVVDIPEDLPRLRADPLRFRQIMLNLLSNAIKFTKSGGEVGLMARVTPENTLRISVVDTGIGMDETGLRRALEPFGRVSDEKYGPTEGTGLGLPIARGLMTLHGGQLEIESAPGAGTTVNIIFPSSRLIAAD